MALLAYFKKSKPSKDILPSPTGPLSLTIQSSCIEAANKRVAEELKRTSEASAAELGAKSTKRGMYQKYTPQEKAEIRSYAAMHGTTAAIRRGLTKFCSSHEIFTTKLIILRILIISRNFCATKIWSYTVPRKRKVVNWIL